METVVSLPTSAPVRGRMPEIVGRAVNRRVLHVGCVDSGLLEQRLTADELLHPKLVGAAAHVVGIDIDADGISLLEQHGFQDLAVVDVSEVGWTATVPAGPFDLIVASEVVEHLENPGVFLRGALEVCLRDGAALLLTVPNAFSPTVLGHLLHNREYVHPDHNCWYSPTTMRRLLERTGFEVTDLRPYTFEATRLLRSDHPGKRRSAGVGVWAGRVRRTPRRLLMTWLRRRSAWFADGLIVEARAARRAPR